MHCERFNKVRPQRGVGTNVPRTRHKASKGPGRQTLVSTPRHANCVHTIAGRDEGGMVPEVGAAQQDGDPGTGRVDRLGGAIAVHEVTHRVVFVSYRGGPGGYNKGKHCAQQVKHSLFRVGRWAGFVYGGPSFMSAEDLPRWT